MPLRSPSLQRQLARWLLLPLLIIWLSGGGLSYYVAVRFADLANDRSLFDSALTLASQVTLSQDSVIVNQPDTALKMIAVDPYDKVYFKVSDGAHGLVAGLQDLPAPPGTEFLPDRPYYHDGRINGRSIRIASIFHHVSSGKKEQLVLVQVAETLAKRRLLASEVMAALALPQLLLVSLILLIVWYGIRRGLSSLARIQEGLRMRSPLDLSPLPEESAPDEVGTLVHALNELLQQLRQAIAVQTRFVADAAHQLRTPLAGIKTQTEFALRQSDPELIRHSLQQLQASNERTIHLVNQLLALARAEPGWEAAKAMVDMVAIACNVTGEWVPLALNKGIDLGFDAQPRIAPLLGSEVLLREMLNNLLDNAVRYVPQGGEITVRVQVSSGSVIVAVEDNGPGIPLEERELVFERFHRGANAVGEGCGLGLAIVREIAHTHGGEVYLVGTTTGAKFEVRLPTSDVRTA